MCASHAYNWPASAHYDRMIDRVYGVTHRQTEIYGPVCLWLRDQLLCAGGKI